MIDKTRQFVYCTFQKEGYHCYPEAANDPKLATGDEMDVSHLASRHMHYFYFKVHVEVNHTNRDIEFIQLRRWLESLYNGGSLELNNKSCEMISDELAEVIHAKYPGVDIRIDVAEDNINGSYTEYTALDRPRPTFDSWIEGERDIARRHSGWNQSIPLAPNAVG